MRRALLLAVRAFDPSTLAPLNYWFEGDQATYQTAGGAAAILDADPAGQWQDLSGNGRHLVQATAGSRPVVKTGANGLDGHSVIRLDGTDDYLTNAIAFPLIATQTRFYVVQKRSAPDGTTRIMQGTSSTNSFLGARSTNSPTGWIWGTNQAGGTQVIGGTAAAWQILVQRFTSNASCETWQNGTALTTFDPNNTYSTTTTFALGATLAGSTPGDYDIATAIGYTVALTNAQINQVVSDYLLRKYPSRSWAAI